MTQKLILGLDIGTSGVRAALYDMRGEMVPGTLVKSERSLESTDDGGSEIDADVAFKQVVQTLDDVLRQPAAKKAEIAHVASCAFWHSLVGVDEKGRPTTKVFGWADTRAGNYTALLKKRFDELEMHGRTGARFHSSFWPAKLLWLRHEFPQAFENTALWLSFSDYVSLRLFGIAATSVSMASGTGLLDLRSCSWEAQLVRFLGIRPNMLPLVSVASYTYRLIERYRRRWPRLKSAAWFPTIGDGAANNIGVGCLKRSRAALMIGTSGAMRLAYKGDPPERIPPGLWCYRIDPERVIIGGALSDGGNLFSWLRANLDLPKDAEEEISARAPDSHGLTVMPFFFGERSTGYHENARGAIVGLRASTDRLDILHASLESVAYRFAEILDQLNTVVRVREIIASGGALRNSPVWTQIIADVLGRDLTLADVDEASMRGAVHMVLETVRAIKSIDTGAKFSNIIRFSSERNAIHRLARKRHAEIYGKLIG